MSTSIPRALSPHRLPHTCIFPCMKTFSITKYFHFSSHESFIGHTSIIMLDHLLIFFFIGHTLKILWTILRYFHWTYSENNVDNPPILFHWTHSKNTMDNPPIFSLDILRKYFEQHSEKYCGQHSEYIVDNTPIFDSKSMSSTHTQFTGCPCAHAMLTPLHKISCYMHNKNYRQYIYIYI